MSILGSILSKVFHGPEAAPAPANTSAHDTAAHDTAPQDAATPDSSHDAGTHEAAPASEAAADTAKADHQPIDVAAYLDGLDEKAPEDLDWRHSIVDLMKLLGLDSSHSARIELAHELHYAGNVDDSASMNVWLHGQVMEKLAENGGKVPDELRHH